MVISHKVHIVDIFLLGTSCAPYTILPSSAFSHIHVCKYSSAIYDTIWVDWFTDWSLTVFWIEWSFLVLLTDWPYWLHVNEWLTTKLANSLNS